MGKPQKYHGAIPAVSDQEMFDMYLANGESSAAVARILKIPASTVRDRIGTIKVRGCRDHAGEKAQRLLEQSNERKNRLQELLDNSSVKPDAIGSIRKARLSEWGGGIKNKEGEWEEHGLYAKSIEFAPETPKFPLIQPATPTSFMYNPYGALSHDTKYVVIVSDAQIGYLRNPKTQALTPTHDPRAIEVCRQIIAHLAPTKVIGIGDWMDWPIFSRYMKHPEYFGVTQQSVQAGYEWKGRLIAAATQGCEFWEIGSNHALRPEKFVLEHNREAMYLTRAKAPDEHGEEWPVFSEPFLLRYAELGIKFSGQYPGGEIEFLPGYFAMHAPPKQREFAGHVVHGHLHKQSVTPSVIHGRDRKEYFTVDTGCLCSVEKNYDLESLHVTRVPSDRGRTDWIQGITVVEYVDGDPHYQTYPVYITDGRARFMGVEFNGNGVSEDWLNGPA